MPTYYFHLRGEGFEVPDLAGRECADDESARAEAERLAAELIESALLSGEAPAPAIVEVADEELRPLMAIPLHAPAG